MTDHAAPTGMPALTLWQPFATLIADGVKVRETRSWQPPQSLIGRRIAIHAGQRMADQWALEQETVDAIVERYGWDWRKLPRGAVVATAIVVAYAQTMGKELDPHGDYRAGRFYWALGDVRRIDPPMPARGAQRIWRWTPEQCPVHQDHYASDWCGEDWCH